MYVCICKGISDRQIKRAVCENGACSVKCLAKQLGVATQCGKCAPLAKAIIKETLAENAEFDLDLVPAL
jgi:bacterioferritin-associated ferredoxin